MAKISELARLRLRSDAAGKLHCTSTQGGDYLLLNRRASSTTKRSSKNSRATDYQAYQAISRSTVDQVGQLLAKQWLAEPPKLGESRDVGDLIATIKLGADLFRLDAEARWRLMQFFIGAPETIIDRWFESEKVKAMIAAHIMPANYAPLSQPGASLAMLHHAVGELNGRAGSWGIVKGGMGGITQAMAKAATVLGVDILTSAAVQRIETRDNRVTGVTLANGDLITAPVVAANTDPKRTFFELLGEEYLPPEFARDLKGFRQESASLRMNLALSELPQFAALPGAEGPSIMPASL